MFDLLSLTPFVFEFTPKYTFPINIIVIANNIKLGQATMTSNFFNIGKNYLNNKSRKTQQNFFSSDYNKKQEQAKEEINKRKCGAFPPVLFSGGDCINSVLLFL